MHIFFIILSLFCLIQSCEQKATNEVTQANVLLIVVDDQGYADLSISRLADDVHTPNIDKLAESGVRFTQAYASSPICSPSRAGIITGCYQQRWGTFWYGGPGLHKKEFKTIPELVKTKKYTTGYIGKVHYGSHDSETDHRSFPLNQGFDYFFGHTSARKHYLNHSQELEDSFQTLKKEHNRQGQSLRQQPLWENFDKVDTIAFSTEMFGRKACEFMENNKENPFFLQLSFNAVHNFTHQLPQEYLDKHKLKGYRDWDPAVEEYYDWYQEGRKPNNPEGREHYLGQLHYLDREVGRVLDKVNDLGLIEKTLIVYISDNGGSTPIYANNYPLRGSKYLLYEGGIRVPMILSYKGKYLANQVMDNVVSGMDILPTICEALDVEVPTNVDGMDLNPLLTGAKDNLEHENLIWDTKQETAVRQGKWKLRTATKDGHAKYEMVELELGEFLYDLEKDPRERTNLIDKYPEIFNELKQVHEDWKEDL